MAIRDGLRLELLNTTLDGAVTNVAGQEASGLEGAKYVMLEAKFLREAGGTTCKVWVQTSLDAGVTWFDVACFAFTTSPGNKLHALRLDVPSVFTPATVPASAALADDTVLNGVLGDRIRTLLTTTGTYSGASSVVISAVVKG